MAGKHDSHKELCYTDQNLGSLGSNSDGFYESEAAC
jgi:hypothetical protein